jgi:hypothetical protein
MPPRGIKKGTERARQYEHIKRSQRARGSRRAEEIAARTVQKERARSGEARTEFLRYREALIGPFGTIRGSITSLGCATSVGAMPFGELA